MLKIFVTAYEKSHQRPALSVYTFQSLEQSDSSQSQPASPGSSSNVNSQTNTLKMQQRKNSNGSIGRERPPIPNRCSSLERPTVDNLSARHGPDSPRGKKLSIPAHLAKGETTKVLFNLEKKFLFKL